MKDALVSALVNDANTLVAALGGQELEQPAAAGGGAAGAYRPADWSPASFSGWVMLARYAAVVTFPGDPCRATGAWRPRPGAKNSTSLTPCRCCGAFWMPAVERDMGTG